jgi:hypothetical protein
VPLTAVALLVLNDHLLKGLWPGAVTGKLSDLAGMVFFPLLLQGLWEVALRLAGRPWGPSRRALVACALITAVGLPAIQVWEPAAGAWRWGLGALQWPFLALADLLSGQGLPPWAPVRHTPDPTDVLVSPAVLLAAWVGWRRSREVSSPEGGESR